jgi:hypothetical protein
LPWFDAFCSRLVDPHSPAPIDARFVNVHSLGDKTFEKKYVVDKFRNLWRFLIALPVLDMIYTGSKLAGPESVRRVPKSVKTYFVQHFIAAMGSKELTSEQMRVVNESYGNALSNIHGNYKRKKERDAEKEAKEKAKEAELLARVKELQDSKPELEEKPAAIGSEDKKSSEEKSADVQGESVVEGKDGMPQDKADMSTEE